MKITSSSVYRLFIFSLCSLSIIACSGDGDSFSEAVEVNDLEISSISISLGSDIDSSRIQIGETEQLTASATNRDGETVDITDRVTWSSSNSNIVKIDSSGETSGLSTGVVLISAELADLSDEFTLEASDQALTTIELTPNSLTMAVCSNGETLVATGIYEDGYDKDLTKKVTWAASPSDRAEVSLVAGVLTTLTVGEVSITATHAGIVSAPLVVDVDGDLLSSISITNENTSLTVGDEPQYVATATYTDTSDETDVTNMVNWTSNNSEVLSVDNNESKGKGKGVTGGVTTLTAICDTLSSKAGDLTVTVSDEPELRNITIKTSGGQRSDIKHDISEDGETLNLKAFELYSDATEVELDSADDIEWSVDEGDDIASVDSNGIVTFTEAGEVIVSGRYENDDEDQIDDIDITVTE